MEIKKRPSLLTQGKYILTFIHKKKNTLKSFGRPNGPTFRLLEKTLVVELFKGQFCGVFKAVEAFAKAPFASNCNHHGVWYNHPHFKFASTKIMLKARKIRIKNIFQIVKLQPL